MDKETRQRLEAVEARLVVLENRPVATLEVTEVKTKRVTNRKPLTPEQKLEHVARLRAGKLAAQARRLAESQISPQVKAIVEKHKAQATNPEAQAEADAKADIKAAELPEDETGIVNRWDNTLSVSQKSKMCKKLGLDGKLGASTWEDLPQADKAIIIKAQNAKAAKKEVK